MNKVFFCLGFFIIQFSGIAQVKSSWKEVSNYQKIVSEKGNNNISLNAKKNYTLDITELKQSLETLHINTLKSNKVSVIMPNNEGKLEEFQVVESSNFVPELQSQYPDIRAYSGKGITDPNAIINFSVSAKSVQAMVFRRDNGSEFIDPLIDNKSLYIVSASRDKIKDPLPFTCKTVEVDLNKELNKKVSQLKSSSGGFKTLRLALSCTGEYAQYFGGSVADALAAMNATMTRVNGIFNRDLAVKLLLIANESSIIYTNAATDPYSDASIGVGDENSTGKWNSELQSTLTSVIGNGNYDIGHLFGATGGGGDAGCIGCVCVNPTGSVPNAKGSGFTSPRNDRPEGDAFDIDFVAHEMGHQLGANHTFSYEVEGTGVSVEPGSGSTIMGYAGITDYDIQNLSDDYFAYASIKQIQDNLATKSCPVTTMLNNQTPTVNAGLDYTIPIGTAFVLNGTASDPNGDSMTYCWEQNDSANNNQNQSNSKASGNKVNGPNFRSFLPTNTTKRYFPDFKRVLLGQLSTDWESVSTVARQLNFVFTVRDNAVSELGQTNSDTMVVTVDDKKGPFVITSQNNSGVSWILGSSQTISWNVNGASSLQGSANVNIKLSTDGGLTFPIILAANTPNDGSEVVTAPTTASKNCRILIEPTENIFYAVSKIPFSIGYTVETSCDNYSFSGPYAIPESQTYAQKTIEVSTANGEITDVNFSVSFRHTYISDVEIEVVSPKGTTVKLFDKSCGGTDASLVLTYDDLGGELNCGTTTNQLVIPAGALAAFNGENPQGTWKLKFRDTGVGDTGTIDAASIEICSSKYVTLDIPPYQIEDFLLYSNPNKGFFTVLFDSPDKNDVQVFVADMMGRKVYDRMFKNSGKFIQNIDLGNVRSGIYIVTIIDGDRKGVSKVVVN